MFASVSCVPLGQLADTSSQVMMYFESILVSSSYHESPLCVQLFPWLLKFSAHKNPTDWSLPVFVLGNSWSRKPVSKWIALEKMNLIEHSKLWIQRGKRSLYVGECDSSPKLLMVKQTGSVIYRKRGVGLQLKYFISQSHLLPLCGKSATSQLPVGLMLT